MLMAPTPRLPPLPTGRGRQPGSEAEDAGRIVSVARRFFNDTLGLQYLAQYTVSWAWKGVHDQEADPRTRRSVIRGASKRT